MSILLSGLTRLFSCCFTVLVFHGCFSMPGPKLNHEVAPKLTAIPPSGEKSEDGGVSLKSKTLLENSAKAASSVVLGSSEQLSQLFFVNVDSLNLRGGPGLGSPKVGTLERGASVQVLKIERDWAQLDKKRWVFLPYLKLASP